MWKMSDSVKLFEEIDNHKIENQRDWFSALITSLKDQEKFLLMKRIFCFFDNFKAVFLSFQFLKVFPKCSDYIQK